MGKTAVKSRPKAKKNTSGKGWTSNLPSFGITNGTTRNVLWAGVALAVAFALFSALYAGPEAGSASASKKSTKPKGPVKKRPPPPGRAWRVTEYVLFQIPSSYRFTSEIKSSN
jgi:hypothetical protein